MWVRMMAVVRAPLLSWKKTDIFEIHQTKLKIEDKTHFATQYAALSPCFLLKFTVC